MGWAARADPCLLWRYVRGSDAAVYQEVCACHVRRFVAGQEQHRVCHFLSFTKPAHGYVHQPALLLCFCVQELHEQLSSERAPAARNTGSDETQQRALTRSNDTEGARRTGTGRSLECSPCKQQHGRESSKQGGSRGRCARTPRVNDRQLTGHGQHCAFAGRVGQLRRGST